jgi:beta-lactam-binding protein with PASTA domain
VIGTDEGDVAGHLAASGLTLGTITRVVNPTRPGIVIAENSPANTIEPLGSPVNLTISLGAVTVPALRSLSLADATRTLTATGLIASISYLAACIEPGHVISQGPDQGVLVAPGSTIRITVDSGTPRTCGSTK